jgi:hypothetical protein
MAELRAVAAALLKNLKQMETIPSPGEDGYGHLANHREAGSGFGVEASSALLGANNDLEPL